MPGVPMVASSPMRHDVQQPLQPVDVHAYEPPWKALCDFALHSDLDRPPGYNHLVNEVSYLFSQPHTETYGGVPLIAAPLKDTYLGFFFSSLFSFFISSEVL